ncbi:hypothetical protein V6N13_097580 [Hibiscus sabdariffa]|uniref:Uncharacterized protein n=1 Tax=Hibiscus sabdariffa TaxID=183260 RepID=A0ABR2BUP0_9ROSI
MIASPESRPKFNNWCYVDNEAGTPPSCSTLRTDALLFVSASRFTFVRTTFVRMIASPESRPKFNNWCYVDNEADAPPSCSTLRTDALLFVSASRFTCLTIGSIQTIRFVERKSKTA